MKKPLLLPAVAACLLTAVSCSMPGASTAAGKRFALVYGVTNYVADASVDVNLAYPSVDAVSMTELLEGRGYAVKSRWVDAVGDVYEDGTAVGALSGDASRAPTKASLLADLSAIGAAMTPDDLLFFYFSGHGTTDAAGTHEYIVPFGGIEKVNGSYYMDEDGCVSDVELGDALSGSIPSSRRVVVLDTCYSGGFIGNTLEVDAIPDDTSYASDTSFVFSASTVAAAIANYAGYASDSSKGVTPYGALVLSACGAGEYSYEDSAYGHGVMTYYLLDTLSGADLNGDGSVTALEWYATARAGVDEGWNSTKASTAQWSSTQHQWVKYYYYRMEPHVSGGAVDFALF